MPDAIDFAPPVTAQLDDTLAQRGIAALAVEDFGGALRTLRAARDAGDLRRETLLNLALAEGHAGDAGLASRLLVELAASFPDWEEPLLRLAERARRAGQHDAAIGLYRRVLDIRPRREAMVSLAAMQLQRGDVVSAQCQLLQACALAPANAEVWDALGIALMLGADADAAESAFARAQNLAPEDVGIAVRRAEASVAAGAAEHELHRCMAASAADPCNVALLTEQAVLLRALGAQDEAAGVLEAAATLAPGSALVLKQFGDVLMSMNRVRAAEAVLAQAVGIAPEDVALRNNHAAALIRLQRFREARDVLQAIIAEHGPATGVLSNLANAQVSLGEQEAGLRTAYAAVDLEPGSGLAWRAVCNAMAYHPRVDAACLLEAHRKASAGHDRPARAVIPGHPVEGRRLRVGLLSATLKTHPVGWLTVAGFEGLDRPRFDLVCFSGALSADTMQRRFAAIASEWIEVAGLSPTAVAERIRQAEIDVLIDLGGYGDLGMMAACARRPAPVQVKWVGAQAHSSGLTEMDWFITDRWETPAGFDMLYSERLWRMPDGYVCYSPPAYAPDVAPLPALTREHVTFGCFNNLAKVTPLVLDAWAEILHGVAGATLVLKCHQCSDAETVARLHAAFATRGIDPERIAARAGSRHRDLLAQYGDIDIVLDPFPYTGGLTTCEALWMGVPTVCLSGQTFSARHSTSHMSNVGLSDWCAESPADYVRLAEAKAADIAALATLRDTLRARVAASPLCDGRRFGRNLGEALEAMWAEATSR